MPRYVDYTNGWTPTMELYHAQTMERTEGYVYLHMRAAAFYRKISLGLAVPGTLLGILLGSAGLATLGTIVDDDLWWLYLTIFVLQILASGLAAINGLLEPNLTAFQHRDVANDAIAFRRKMELELIEEPGRRIDCNDFSEMVNLEYDKLMNTDMSVPDHIIREYVAKVDPAVAMPEMVLPFRLTRGQFQPMATPRRNIVGDAPEQSEEAPPIESSASGTTSPGRALWAGVYCQVLQQNARRGGSSPSITRARRDEVSQPHDEVQDLEKQ